MRSYNHVCFIGKVKECSEIDQEKNFCKVRIILNVPIKFKDSEYLRKLKEEK